MKKLAIDEMMFHDAFNRDMVFHDAYPHSAYLELESGNVVWIYHEDEDGYMEAGISPKENRALRQRIKASPEQYLEIPGLDHGDDHDILRAFLKSSWTEDKQARDKAWSAYFGSIGGWKKAVGDEAIVHAFYNFREQRAKEMGEEFLREHGVEPQWR